MRRIRIRPPLLLTPWGLDQGRNSPNLGLIYPLDADLFLKIAIFGKNRTFMTPPTPQKNSELLVDAPIVFLLKNRPI